VASGERSFTGESNIVKRVRLMSVASGERSLMA